MISLKMSTQTILIQEGSYNLSQPHISDHNFRLSHINLSQPHLSDPSLIIVEDIKYNLKNKIPGKLKTK